MKFLFASDSFKGTLSSPKTAELLTCAAREIFPDCICDSIEVADGGEGTTDAVLSAVNGKSSSLKVHGPLWEELTCSYGMLDEKRAVMEMAAAQTTIVPLMAAGVFYYLFNLLVAFVMETLEKKMAYYR